MKQVNASTDAVDMSVNIIDSPGMRQNELGLIICGWTLLWSGMQEGTNSLLSIWRCCSNEIALKRWQQ